MKSLHALSPRRARLLLAALAAVSTALAVAAPGAGPSAAASGPAAKRRLVVMVTGDGRAVPEADLLLRGDGMPDRKLHTDERGEARWSPPAELQRLKLRVIATGWKTHHLEILLEAAAGMDQAVLVALEPDPPPAPPRP